MDRKELVIALLKRKKEITSGDVMSQIGCNSARAGKLLKDLQSEGRVEKIYEGHKVTYRLSEDRSIVSEDRSIVSEDRSTVSEDRSIVSEDRSTVKVDKPKRVYTYISGIFRFPEECKPGDCIRWTNYVGYVGDYYTTLMHESDWTDKKGFLKDNLEVIKELGYKFTGN